MGGRLFVGGPKFFGWSEGGPKFFQRAKGGPNFFSKRGANFFWRLRRNSLLLIKLNFFRAFGATLTTIYNCSSTLSYDSYILFCVSLHPDHIHSMPRAGGNSFCAFCTIPYFLQTSQLLRLRRKFQKLFH